MCVCEGGGQLVSEKYVGVLGAVWTMNLAAGLFHVAAEFKPRRVGKKMEVK